MKLDNLVFEEVVFDQMSFSDQEEFDRYMNAQWEKDPIQTTFNHVNDRFEMVLRNSANLRHDVKTGVRETNETIDITMYQWIQRFMSYTKKKLIVDGISLAGINGSAVFHLYDKTVEFVAKR